ncbi:hypothetical protein COLO4_19330 [Corchorus olitorius]|uniref:Uncharacterized protein n=1 Tax=Corchorus olitorius TaxID=93759 RepID=A0A1R3J5V5_9ROSI|nr:hypothetical protein COLO4_19330 [Corchorus olitorius]
MRGEERYFTRVNGLGDHVQERLVYVKDNKFETRHLILQALGCAVQLIVEGNSILSCFNFATHSLPPARNKVMAAGKQPVGGRVVTPILHAPILSKNPEAAEAKLAPVKRAFICGYATGM